MHGRRSIIRNIPAYGSNDSGSAGPDMMYVVDFYQDEQLVETRALPGKSIHYAKDCAENWDNGIIKTETSSS